MKNLTVQIPEDVLERAERRAAKHGASLSGEVAKFVKHYAEDEATAATANGATAAPTDPVKLARLWAALDHARNTTSVGQLKRDELYDRPVLH